MKQDELEMRFLMDLALDLVPGSIDRVRERWSLLSKSSLQAFFNSSEADEFQRRIVKELVHACLDACRR
jgi:hypothetical protein